MDLHEKSARVLERHGLRRLRDYGLSSYILNSYGGNSYDLNRYGLNSYALSSYCQSSYGLNSYGTHGGNVEGPDHTLNLSIGICLELLLILEPCEPGHPLKC